MKIVLLSREYPPDTAWGGIALTYEKIAAALANRGHQVHVICQAVTQPGYFIQEGVEIHRTGSNPGRYSAMARIDYTFSAWLKLRQIKRQHGIDIVCASLWGAEGLLCSLFEPGPLIITTHTSAQEILTTRTYSGKKEFLNLKILSFLENFTISRAACIIANSNGTKVRISDKFPASIDKIHLIHHAVDTAQYKPAEIGAASKLEPETTSADKTVLCVGRMERRKGSDILFQAVRQVVEQRPRTVFIMLGQDSQTAPGGGSFRDYLIDQAAQAGIKNNLIFIESVSQEKLVQMYQSCDIYVSASLYESFGLTVIEALACGKPIVATPTGIVPELEPFHLPGISIVPAGDAPKLAAALMDFLSLSEEELKVLGVQNRCLAEDEFALSSWAEKINQVFESTFTKNKAN